MSASPQSITTLEQNKQLAVRWFEEVWNQGNRDAIAKLFAPDGVLYDGSTVIRGPAEFEAFYDRLRAQFSDFRISPVILVAEGDLVGKSVYEGRGAGAGPTASAVISDILDIARGQQLPT